MARRGLFSKVGKALAKPVHFATSAGGAIVGGVTGGPQGALMGWKAGDKIGNIQEDALAGRSVRKNLANNALQAAVAGAGAYGAAKAQPRIIGGTTFPSFGNTVSTGAEAKGGKGWDWSNVLNSIPGAVQKVGSYVKDNASNIALGGLAGWQALNSAKASKRAGRFQDAAINQAKERWASGAPLRAAAQQRLLNPVRPDLSSTFNDPTNPFSTPHRTPPPSYMAGMAAQEQSHPGSTMMAPSGATPHPLPVMPGRDRTTALATLQAMPRPLPLTDPTINDDLLAHSNGKRPMFREMQ